ncbi:hypothetical protein B0H65DRAFT_4711 [Neurospora tetraspora]|uniref:Uncharacterized protein n=1 Tax=Neurospora tetraspora TaxID=94610 RepID=A0AAE0JMI5_9PEZI|nr:hypothetical protein B0H65DRAFT_4711 [Neurospora tetraspora]
MSWLSVSISIDSCLLACMHCQQEELVALVGATYVVYREATKGWGELWKWKISSHLIQIPAYSYMTIQVIRSQEAGTNRFSITSPIHQHMNPNTSV